MKLSINKIYRFFIVFVILVEYDCFKLVGLGELTRDSFVFILMLCIGVISRLSIKTKNTLGAFFKENDYYVGVVIVCVVLELVYTIAMYGSNPIDTFSVLIRWLTVFFCYPLLTSYVKGRRGEKPILHSLIMIGTIMYAVKTAIWFLYNYKDIVLTPQIVYEYGEEWTRNNLFRIDDSSLMYLFLFACLVLYNESKKKKYLAFIGIQIAFSIIVTAARSTTVALIALVVIYYLITGRSTLCKLKKYMVVLIGMIAIIGSTFFQNFLSSFRLSGSNSSLSSVTRLNALSYYFNTLTNEGNILRYLFGIGALSTNVPYEKAILRGPSGIYFIEDIGIIGFLLQYGCIAVVMIISLIYVLKKSANRTILYDKTKITYNNCIFLIMCVMIPSILAQSIFDKSRIVSLPFYVSIGIYYSKKDKIGALKKS